MNINQIGKNLMRKGERIGDRVASRRREALRVALAAELDALGEPDLAVAQQGDAVVVSGRAVARRFRDGRLLRWIGRLLR